MIQSIGMSPTLSILGREREASEVVRLLRSVRLLTLTGPGGVGKTTLALHVARAVAPQFPAGVVFVDLSPLRDPALLLSRIAEALGIAATRDDELHGQLVAYLHERRLLLVLDNMEQVLAAAPAIGRLLAAAPQVSIFCTSRAALRIHGEQEYPLAPLLLPQSDTVEAINAAPAVQLLLQRARAARAEITLNSANAAGISAICRHLDGLPLAIELAAARMRVLTPQDLLARLSRSLPLLTTGPRDAPDRQRTLRNTIAWSYNLLSPAAQAHLRQLAVFDGGAAIEAIAAVWGSTAADPALIDALTNLVEQSLVVWESDGAVERYRLFETVREFAAEQLAVHGEVAPARARHAAYYRALAETAEPELTGKEQRAWITRLSREQANMLAALDWLLDPAYGDPAEALRLGNALARFWWINNRLIDGRSALERILAVTRQTTMAASAQQATLLQWTATMAWGQADYRVAQQHYDEGLALCRALNDPQATARALKGLGTLAREQGRADAARQLFEEALALMRQADDTWGVTLILSHLGMTLETLGQYEAAQALQRECLDLSYELGDTWSVAYALKDLAYLALQLGDSATARAQVDKALALFEQLGDTQGMAYALFVLGDIALSAEVPQEAAAHYTQMQTILQAIGDQRGVALAQCGLADAALAVGDYPAAHRSYHAALAQQDAQRNPVTFPRGLEGAARLATAVHEPERAVHLFAAAQSVRDTMNIPLPASQRDLQYNALTQVRRALEQQQFAAAWMAGQALSDVEAIALAGRALPPPKLTAHAPTLEHRPTIAPDHSTLTAREREVLALLARGMSNSAIATALQMSPHTVHSHVRTIFSKLDVTNRAAATRVALELGLVLTTDERQPTTDNRRLTTDD
jgi:predicted ATPase/DNA-binding CsgD family transcriptional regulator/predicted negative regulator of RcsB-dependent stress response